MIFPILRRAGTQPTSTPSTTKTPTRSPSGPPSPATPPAPSTPFSTTPAPTTTPASPPPRPTAKPQPRPPFHSWDKAPPRVSHSYPAGPWSRPRLSAASEEVAVGLCQAGLCQADLVTRVLPASAEHSRPSRPGPCGQHRHPGAPGHDRGYLPSCGEGNDPRSPVCGARACPLPRPGRGSGQAGRPGPGRGTTRDPCAKTAAALPWRRAASSHATPSPVHRNFRGTRNFQDLSGSGRTM